MGNKRKRKNGERSQVYNFPQGIRPSILASSTPPAPNEWELPTESSTIFPQAQSLQIEALQKLLQNPIHFLAATKLTLEDEKRMAPPVRRPNVIKVDTTDKTDKAKMKNGDNTSSMSGKWQRQISFSRSRGFPNPRNRCYRNAVLQALLHIPKLVNWMEGGHAKCDSPMCTLCRLRNICLRYWGQHTDQVAINAQLEGLETVLRRTRPFIVDEWRFNIQQDANLFLIHLLNAIEESSSSAINVMNALLGHSTVTRERCAECSYRKVRRNTCQQEKIVYARWEHEQSLEQILRDQVFDNDVHKDILCPRCNVNRNWPYSIRLCTAPDVLIVNFVRFEFNRKRGGIQKKEDHITFPEELNLTDLSETETQLHYNLQAVVHHAGDMDYGHYIAVTKSPLSTWELIDDRSVSHTTIEAALNPSRTLRGGDDWTPYLLFYVKVEDSGAIGNSLSMNSDAPAPKGNYSKTEKAIQKSDGVRKYRAR